MDDLAGRQPDRVEVFRAAELPRQDVCAGSLRRHHVDVVRSDHDHHDRIGVVAGRIGELADFCLDSSLLDNAGQEISLADEFRDEWRGRHVVDRFRCVELFQVPLVEHGDPVSDREGFIVIVRDKDGSGLCSVQQVLQFLPHASRHVRIEIAEGLIQEQHHGMLGQGTSQGHPLLLPAGQFVRVPALETAQAGQPQRLLDLGEPLFAGKVTEAERDIFLDA